MLHASPLPPLHPLSSPRARRLVSTRDVDEARLAFSRLYAESTLDPLHEPFGCTLDVAAFGGVNIVSASWSGGARTVVPLLGERYVLSCSGGGGADGEVRDLHRGDDDGFARRARLARVAD